MSDQQADQPKKKGMTSLEAAALIISQGHTDDINKAATYAQGVSLEIDGLQRAHLRRMMGFDFEIQQLPNVLLITSKEKPFARTRCDVWEGETDEYGNIIDEALINRLVDSCLRLKKHWIAEKRRSAQQ